jgi:hypothetical protein
MFFFPSDHLGTLPLRALPGVGRQLLNTAARLRALQAAAWCVVLTGMLSLARGAEALRTAERSEEPKCPLCR